MNSYYTTTLYPLQDKVLDRLTQLHTPFYLTGGTALSRGYFHHRYSDDLDFFVNQSPDYLDIVEQIIADLSSHFSVTISHRSSHFTSLVINEVLKVDFVNDVSFHSGSLMSLPLFFQVDNIHNILSNKLSALISRDEPKDVVDIWIIAKNQVTDWPTIFRDTNSKATGIFPPDIARRLSEFPPELLNVIKWLPDQTPSPQQFASELGEITHQLLA